jgi:hypothetical protein
MPVDLIERIYASSFPPGEDVADPAPEEDDDEEDDEK